MWQNSVSLGRLEEVLGKLMAEADREYRPVRFLCFSFDGQTLAAAGDPGLYQDPGKLRIWNWPSGLCEDVLSLSCDVGMVALPRRIRAQLRGIELCVEPCKSPETMAWYPISKPLAWTRHGYLVTHQFGRTWANMSGGCLDLFRLEGEATAPT